MPQNDKTGPLGKGPMTGGQRGYCSSAPKYQPVENNNETPMYGRGRGGLPRHQGNGNGQKYFGQGFGRNGGRGLGLGLGRGFGKAGFGFRRMYDKPLSPEEELDYLTRVKANEEKKVSDLEKRISELKGEE